MKKKLVLIVALFVCCAAFIFADPAEGFWISKDEKTGASTAGWLIWVENGTLKGQILSAQGATPNDYAGSGKKKSYKDFNGGAVVDSFKLIGTTWIWGLEKKSEGVWQKGNIIDPTDGSKYSCKITFHKAGSKGYSKDTLEMRGEIGLGLGRSQFWERATEAEAISIK